MKPSQSVPEKINILLPNNFTSTSQFFVECVPRGVYVGRDYVHKNLASIVVKSTIAYWMAHRTIVPAPQIEQSNVVGDGDDDHDND